ncbi:hypothetical protein AB986_03860 [Alkalihalobacillus macyae]|uniref:Uncharacterized protein n=1 Tax=Guptibacillus hwajinpoensis TaxID=208199 RepID=A0A0J6CZA8_9BACL|nr:hypothetical protein AB986_03860 [Alkalihalobacillus macyae]
MSFGKRFLITCLIVMVVMGIEYIILPDILIIKAVALSSTTMVVISIINKKYPLKKKADS